MAQVSECTTQADAARRLGVTRHRVNNLLQMGRLRAEHLADGTPVIPLAAIDEYARQRDERSEAKAKKRPAKSPASTSRRKSPRAALTAE